MPMTRRAALRSHSGLVIQVKPKNLTALQLPQLDIPVPEKPQIDLPSVPAVPVYQFQLPDIKTELESAVLPVVDKAKSLLPQVCAYIPYTAMNLHVQWS